jgi:calcineurin-like phosphoesterase family protein
VKTLLIFDTHWNHGNIKSYCQRPDNFSKLMVRNIQQRVAPEDTVIHGGDVFMGKVQDWQEIQKDLPGTWILIRGNHDRKRSCSWWMDHGFKFACDGIMFRNWWITHEPANSRPGGCQGNIHGHLHNIWHGFADPNLKDKDEEWMRLRRELRYPWQRLFAVEYTNYCPIEFDHFVSHPDSYYARGIRHGKNPSLETETESSVSQV